MSHSSVKNSVMPTSSIRHIGMDSELPYLQIVEQPIKNYRFRYESEQGTHGPVTGQSTNKANKCFPTVHLHNFTGTAVIKCSLLQENLFPHSHRLARKGSDEQTVSPGMGYTAKFQQLVIVYTKKEYIVDALHNKLIERLKFGKTKEGEALHDKTKLRQQAEDGAKNINLNKVCLCFEAFETVGGNRIRICEPMLSTAINNAKSTIGDLKITRLSTNISDVSGGDELLLFVEKVNKTNIKVRFFETDENDETDWEDWGTFSENDVHHQYGIALTTPPYRKKDIEENVNCWIQLVRPSDDNRSKPLEFRYKPSELVSARKRSRKSFGSTELPVLNYEDIRDFLADSYVGRFEVEPQMDTDGILVSNSMFVTDSDEHSPNNQSNRMLVTDSVATPSKNQSNKMLATDSVASSFENQPRSMLEMDDVSTTYFIEQSLEFAPLRLIRYLTSFNIISMCILALSVTLIYKYY